MSGSDALNLDPLSFGLFLAFTLVANAASGVLSQFGWRSAVQKEIELCKGLMDIDRDEDMLKDIALTKESIHNHLARVYTTMATRRSFFNTFRIYISETTVSTTICCITWLFAAPFIISDKSLLIPTILLGWISAIIVGIVMHTVSTLLRMSRERKKGNTE